MKGSTAFGLGCAFLAGAALAFPAGLMLANHRQPEQARHAAAASAARRLLNPFSPQVTQDPAFVAQLRKGIEPLERSCRTTGQYCREAAQLRQWLAAHGATP